MEGGGKFLPFITSALLEGALNSTIERSQTATREEKNPITNKSDGNTRIYYKNIPQLASGKHDRPTRNVTGIITSPTTANMKSF
jgi:hypothetical protein